MPMTPTREFPSPFFADASGGLCVCVCVCVCVLCLSVFPSLCVCVVCLCICAEALDIPFYQAFTMPMTREFPSPFFADASGGVCVCVCVRVCVRVCGWV